MVSLRQLLPQLRGSLLLADGGIETTLTIPEGIELPDFAAFQILRRDEGIASLRKYIRTFAALAQHHGTGVILESATWRASIDWGERLGLNAKQMDEVNLRAIQRLQNIREEFNDPVEALVISGCLGPRGDGYTPGKTMFEKEADAYHTRAIEVFQESGADMVSALTMNHAHFAEHLIKGEPWTERIRGLRANA